MAHHRTPDRRRHDPRRSQLARRSARPHLSQWQARRRLLDLRLQPRARCRRHDLRHARRLHGNYQARSFAKAQLQRERERLADLFQQAPAFFALLRGPEPRLRDGQSPLSGSRRPAPGARQDLREAVPEAEGQGLHCPSRLGLSNRYSLHRTKNAHPARPQRLARASKSATSTSSISLAASPTEPSPESSSSASTSPRASAPNRPSCSRKSSPPSAASPAPSPTKSITPSKPSPTSSISRKAEPCRRRRSLSVPCAESELQRVSVIANQTLRFHRQSTNPKAVTPEELIDSTLPLYQGRLNNSQVSVERRDRTSRPVTVLRRRDPAGPEQPHRERHRCHAPHRRSSSAPQPRSASIGRPAEEAFSSPSPIQAPACRPALCSNLRALLHHQRHRRNRPRPLGQP